MLVLSRKTGETVVIDGGVRITVVSVGRSTIRIGVEAPTGKTILREELLAAAEARAAGLQAGRAVAGQNT